MIVLWRNTGIGRYAALTVVESPRRKNARSGIVNQIQLVGLDAIRNEARVRTYEIKVDQHVKNAKTGPVSLSPRTELESELLVRRTACNAPNERR